METTKRITCYCSQSTHFQHQTAFMPPSSPFFMEALCRKLHLFYKKNPIKVRKSHWWKKGVRGKFKIMRVRSKQGRRTLLATRLASPWEPELPTNFAPQRPDELRLHPERYRRLRERQVFTAALSHEAWGRRRWRDWKLKECITISQKVAELRGVHLFQEPQQNLIHMFWVSLQISPDSKGPSLLSN